MAQIPHPSSQPPRPVSSTAAAPASTRALDEILDIQRMLHLAYHRNKNQHRSAKWWSSLGALRRQICRLVGELEDVKQASGSQVLAPQVGKKKNLRREWEEGVRMERAVRVERRVIFLREIMMGRCWMAFSSVVADTQYSALGLMLIGTLARLDSLIAPMTPESTASSAVPIFDPNRGNETTVLASERVFEGEDLGEMVLREELPDRGGGDVGNAHSVEEKIKKRDLGLEDMVVGADADLRTPTPTRMKKPAKKRRKKGDVFDEIFSALI